MKKMLILEDEIAVAKAIRDSWEAQYETTIVSDLPDFDEYLLESPGMLAYDAVLMDLSLDLGAWAKNGLTKVFPEMRGPIIVNGTSVELPIRARGVVLHGLTYLRQRILSNPKYRDIAKARFTLISGHVPFVKEEHVFQRYDIDFPIDRLIDKGVDFSTNLRL